MDPNRTSTWWSVTAFNDEIIRCEDKDSYPPFVRQLLGGREICPKSGREHYQGALQCTSAMRRKQIKSWLPTAHLEQSKKTVALKQYAMKPETASGEKLVNINENPFLSADKICELIAEKVQENYSQTDSQTDRFWFGVRKILTSRPQMAGQLMNPSLRNFYIKTESVWACKALKKAQSMIEDHSITCLQEEIGLNIEDV